MKTPCVNIGGRPVGAGHPVFIVAELSANHGQRLDLAKEAIHAAAEAGADAIKIQTYTPDTITLNSNAEAFTVRSKNVWSGRTLHDLYREAMTPWEWHAELQEEAKKAGLIFFSTPFDVTAVEYLEALDVPCHKIASFELNDLPLVEHVASRGKPIILSTGMASLGEIEAAVRTCRGVGNDQIMVLRCVSAYPAKPESMHLASLETLRSFGTVVGLSDHTRESTVAIAAVTLGASFVEKHFIVRRSDGGPDSFFSLEPAEFKQMVLALRDVEKAIDVPRFGPSEDEKTNYGFRRSLFVSRPVKAGEILTADSVRSVRPSIGLDPRHLHEVLGRPAARDMPAATALSWGDVGGDLSPPSFVTKADAVSVGEALRRLNELSASVSWGRGDGSGGRVCGIFDAETPVAHAETRATAHGDTWDILSFASLPAKTGGDLFVPSIRALEAEARSQGAIRLRASIAVANEGAVSGLKRAGFYHFVESGPPSHRTLSCERRLTRF